eukprot:Cvel_26242.t1-p1 / transcript=Cvel_26242.t1 / gene=Cvel_26242 / organism=Chromera_velia_CCMP2878 / gene_product=Serine/threonine-protein phosphatase BSL1, putative / transcript_product=Serine/threonine-protein phosphatase BSL1, putative / location=Cvel_scaffold3095:295-15614(-) / protein_length=1417 / sequence_SO=supercontig / SO=protein_coding / is_pseudo=false
MPRGFRGFGATTGEGSGSGGGSDTPGRNRVRSCFSSLATLRPTVVGGGCRLTTPGCVAGGMSRDAAAEVCFCVEINRPSLLEVAAGNSAAVTGRQAKSGGTSTLPSSAGAKDEGDRKLKDERSRPSVSLSTRATHRLSAKVCAVSDRDNHGKTRREESRMRRQAGRSGSTGLQHGYNATQWGPWKSHGVLLQKAVQELGWHSRYNVLKRMFREAEKGKAGYLDAEEFERLVSSLGCLEPQFHPNFFQLFDRNQDDYINENDFIGGMMAILPVTPNDPFTAVGQLRLQFIFLYYDFNRNGLLELPELRRLVHHLHAVRRMALAQQKKEREHRHSNGVHPTDGTEDEEEELPEEEDESRFEDLARSLMDHFDGALGFGAFFNAVSNKLLNGTSLLLRWQKDVCYEFLNLTDPQAAAALVGGEDGGFQQQTGDNRKEGGGMNRERERSHAHKSKERDRGNVRGGKADGSVKRVHEKGAAIKEKRDSAIPELQDRVTAAYPQELTDNDPTSPPLPQDAPHTHAHTLTQGSPSPSLSPPHPLPDAPHSENDERGERDTPIADEETHQAHLTAAFSAPAVGASVPAAARRGTTGSHAAAVGGPSSPPTHPHFLRGSASSSNPLPPPQAGPSAGSAATSTPPSQGSAGVRHPHPLSSTHQSAPRVGAAVPTNSTKQNRRDQPEGGRASIGSQNRRATAEGGGAARKETSNRRNSAASSSPPSRPTPPSLFGAEGEKERGGGRKSSQPTGPSSSSPAFVDQDPGGDGEGRSLQAEADKEKGSKEPPFSSLMRSSPLTHPPNLTATGGAVWPVVGVEGDTVAVGCSAGETVSLSDPVGACGGGFRTSSSSAVAPPEDGAHLLPPGTHSSSLLVGGQTAPVSEDHPGKEHMPDAKQMPQLSHSNSYASSLGNAALHLRQQHHEAHAGSGQHPETEKDCMGMDGQQLDGGGALGVVAGGKGTKGTGREKEKGAGAGGGSARQRRLPSPSTAMGEVCEKGRIERERERALDPSHPNYGGCPVSSGSSFSSLSPPGADAKKGKGYWGGQEELEHHSSHERRNSGSGSSDGVLVKRETKRMVHLAPSVVDSRVCNFDNALALEKESDSCARNAAARLAMPLLVNKQTAAPLEMRIVRALMDVAGNPAALQKTRLCTAEEMLCLCDRVVLLFMEEDTLVDVLLPCRVYGDVHGQLPDLLALFETFSWPDKRRGDILSMNYVFLGDFVDRGTFSLEVVALMFSLKLLYPRKVFLLRGNHEDRAMNANYGFKAECQSKLGANEGESVWQRVNDVFEFLPLAALVEDSVLCVHGGIGSSVQSLADLQGIPKPISVISEIKEDTTMQQRIVLDCLWSDPTENDSVTGTHPSPRGQNTCRFGPDRVGAFCEKNNLQLIIRAHECVASGFEYFAGGKLLTVFSATNYCNQYGNDGAMV